MSVSITFFSSAVSCLSAKSTFDIPRSAGRRAFAARGQIPEARAALAEVRAARDWWEDQDLVFLSNARPEQLLEIASLVLAARIDGAQGNWATAVPSLEAAVALQDALPYTEPPPWYFPTREALGDALLRSGRPEAAEAVFREQLKHTPRNGWSLFGLAESLRAQGKDARKVQARFEEAWTHADVTLEGAVL